jgi:hypothetical protein
MCDKSIPNRSLQSPFTRCTHSPLESHPLDSTFQLIGGTSKLHGAIQGPRTLCATSITSSKKMAFISRGRKEWRITEKATANLFFDASSVLCSEERSETKERRKRSLLLHSSWAAFSPFQIALGHNNQPKSQNLFNSVSSHSIVDRSLAQSTKSRNLLNPVSSHSIVDCNLADSTPSGQRFLRLRGSTSRIKSIMKKRITSGMQWAS